MIVMTDLGISTSFGLIISRVSDDRALSAQVGSWRFGPAGSATAANKIAAAEEGYYKCL